MTETAAIGTNETFTEPVPCTPSMDCVNMDKTQPEIAFDDLKLNRTRMIRVFKQFQVNKSSSVCLLNNILPDLKYELVSELGDPNDKQFIFQVQVNGHCFRGGGRSKKLAKNDAAILVLNSLVEYANRHFMTENPATAQSEPVINESVATKRPSTVITPIESPSGPKMSLITKGPAQYLNELIPGSQIVYEYRETALPQNNKYVATVQLKKEYLLKVLGDENNSSKKQKKWVSRKQHLAAQKKKENDTPDLTEMRETYEAVEGQNESTVEIKEEVKLEDPSTNEDENDESMDNAERMDTTEESASLGRSLFPFVTIDSRRIRSAIKIMTGFEEMKFEGYGPNKKLAKQSCARVILTDLFRVPVSVTSSLHLLSLTEDVNLVPQTDGQFQVWIRSRKSPTTPRSKKRSANNLEGMSDETKVHGDEGMGNESDRKEGLIPGTNLTSSEFYQDPSLSNKIAHMIADKYEKLFTEADSADQRVPKPHLLNFSRYKVRSGIVMERFMHGVQSLSVVCITSGTKCINGEYLSFNGTAINDCHAEVLGRRCLVDFMLSELEKLANDSNSMTNGDIENIFSWDFLSSQFKLKDDVKFHLYISSAPCGDSRIFSPHDKLNDDTENDSNAAKGEGISPSMKVDSHFRRKSRGKLRVKIEGGEGTVLSEVSKSDQEFIDHQTWDGIIQGGLRLKTMSCSDKIAKWNIVGVQGSLLSIVLSHPIYFESIVLGSLFHPSHMFRACSGRSVDSHIPKFGLVSSVEVRSPTKSPGHAVVWASNWNDDIEVLDSQHGVVIQQDQLKSKTLNQQKENQSYSAISKRCIFQRWMKLIDILSPSIIMQQDINSCLREICHGGNRKNTYSKVKSLSLEYQRKKEKMYASFASPPNTMGKWMSKPVEQDNFHL